MYICIYIIYIYVIFVLYRQTVSAPHLQSEKFFLSVVKKRKFLTGVLTQTRFIHTTSQPSRTDEFIFNSKSEIKSENINPTDPTPALNHEES